MTLVTSWVIDNQRGDEGSASFFKLFGEAIKSSTMFQSGLSKCSRTLRAKYALPPVVFYVVPYKNRRRCGLVSKKTTGGSVFLALHV